MRIGIVTGEYPPMQGGVGDYSHILAHEIILNGHKAFVFSSTKARGPDPDIPLTNTIDKWGFSSLRAIKHWALKEQLDIVNLQFQTAAYHMSPWIHFLPQYIHGIPVVTTFHDLRYPYLFPKAGRLRDRIVMHLARSSAGVIVTNHEDFDRVSHLEDARLIPVGSNIIYSIPDGFDPLPWRKKAGAEAGDFLLAHFGFINRSKGIEVLLRSLTQLRSEGVPARLVMIGGRTGTSDPTNAAYVAEIDRTIDRWQLTPYVHWTGYVDDEAVSSYLEASDVVVLPFLDGASYRRGSLMAAIAHFCLIVTTTPMVPIDNFINGGDMLLVPPGDSRALAEALYRLHDNKLLRRHLLHGVIWLSEHFLWGKISYDYLQFLQCVVGEKDELAATK